MKKASIYLIPVTYLLLAFFSIRIPLLQPGTLGHRWDWGIPSTSQEIKQVLLQNLWAWNENSLGYAQASSFNSLPIKVLIGGFGFLGFNGPFVSKFLVILAIFCGANFMFLLIKTVTKKVWPAFLAGLFYGFSPFMFNALVGGAVTQYFSFAFIPLVFYWFEKLNQTLNHNGTKKLLMILKYSFFTSLSLVPIFSALPALIITLGLFFGWILVRSSPQTNGLGGYKVVIQSISYFLATLVFLFFLNTYAIAPYFASLGSFYQREISSVDKTIITENLSKYTASFWDTIIGTTFWEDAFRYVISDTLMPFILGSGYLLLTFVLITIFVKRRKRNKKLVWFLISIFLIGSIFASGKNSFLGSLVVVIMTKFSFLSIFRSPQWLVIIPNFCFAFLIGLAISYLEDFCLKNGKLVLSLSKDYKLKILKIVPLVLILIFLYPFWKGTLGDEGMDVFQKNPNLKALEYLQKNHSRSHFNRTIFIPKNHSLIFLETDFQQKRQGNDPYLSFPPFLTTVTDFGEKVSNELVHQIEKVFVLLGDARNTASWFQKLGIEWIGVRHEAVSMFYPFPHYSGWSSFLLTHRFEDDQGNFQALYDGNLLTVFKNLKSPYPPIFFTDHVAYIDAENKFLFDLARVDNFNQISLPIFVQEEPNAKKNKSDLLALSSLIITTDSPTNTPNNQSAVEIPKDGEYNLNALDAENEFFDFPKTKELNILKENQEPVKNINLQATNSTQAKLNQGTYILQWPEIVPKNLFSPGNLTIKPFITFGQYQIIIPPHNQPINIAISQQEGSHYELIPQQGTTLSPNTQPFAIIFQPLFYSKTAKLIIDGMTENEIKQIIIYRLEQPKAIFTLLRQDFETDSIIQPNFTKKSPTNYEITDLEKISKILVFNQSFSPNWEAFLINQSGQKVKIDEDKHFLVNGFANGWIVEDLDNVDKISVEYRLQKYVGWGGATSGLTVLIGLVILMQPFKKSQNSNVKSQNCNSKVKTS